MPPQTFASAAKKKLLSLFSLPPVPPSINHHHLPPNRAGASLVMRNALLAAAAAETRPWFPSSSLSHLGGGKRNRPPGKGEKKKRSGERRKDDGKRGFPRSLSKGKFFSFEKKGRHLPDQYVSRKVSFCIGYNNLLIPCFLPLPSFTHCALFIPSPYLPPPTPGIPLTIRAYGVLRAVHKPAHSKKPSRGGSPP